MQSLFREKGYLFSVEDTKGEPVSRMMSEGRPVNVEIKYELKPSPRQVITVDIYGRNLFSLGRTKERLELENGVILTGRTYGGQIGGDGEGFSRIRLEHIEERKIELNPTEVTASPSVVDAVILGIVSTYPLGHGLCGNGIARPGFPFSFRESFPKEIKGKWSTAALRLYYENFEITIVGTSSYWQKCVEAGALQHDAIIGIRRPDGNILAWEAVNRVVLLISNFIGWINHCLSPVFHVKGYRKGKLVYRRYELQPHPTVCRDQFSWLPMSNHNESHGNQTKQIQELFKKFAIVWEGNKKTNSLFHIALDMLRSRSKGAPWQAAAIGYLRDTLGACSILINMLVDRKTGRSRRDIVWACLKEIGIDDELPSISHSDRELLVQKHPELWWIGKKDRAIENDIGTLSRPLSNLQNWLIHIEDPKNAERLTSLSEAVQRYFVEVSTWLADLMVMKVVEYHGWYFNRLSRETEIVPWANQRVSKESRKQNLHEN